VRNLLDTIVQAARERSEQAEQNESYAALSARARASRAARRPFLRRLRDANGAALIAEIKRASPSAGLLVRNFDAAAIARTYTLAGADAISILTEPDHFLGDLAFLAEVRGVTDLPLLRKDFLSRRYDVAQSAAAGADCVLLIVTILDDAALRDCLEEAASFDLDALVEVHDEEELDRAVAAGAALIGVNNRDLRTLSTDLATSELLLPRIPHEAFAISESGLQEPEDLARLRRAGAKGFLIGESLLRAESPAEAIATFRAATQVEATA
jgi:indole-3-glycerol phosphate synthase